MKGKYSMANRLDAKHGDSWKNDIPAGNLSLMLQLPSSPINSYSTASSLHGVLNATLLQEREKMVKLLFGEESSTHTVEGHNNNNNNVSASSEVQSTTTTNSTVNNTSINLTPAQKITDSEEIIAAENQNQESSLSSLLLSNTNSNSVNNSSSSSSSSSEARILPYLSRKTFYPVESEEGNCEYKRLLCDCSPERLQQLTTQMQYLGALVRIF